MAGSILAQIKTVLLTSGVQQTNNPLWQAINQMLDYLIKFENQTNAALSPGSGGLSAPTYLTVNNETATLPNSRRLLAGNAITFDDSVGGIRTINEDLFVTVQVPRVDTSGPLTDGDILNPEFIFADGQCIMTTYLATELLFAGDQPLRIEFP